jgi:hypothetical protein
MSSALIISARYFKSKDQIQNKIILKHINGLYTIAFWSLTEIPITTTYEVHAAVFGTLDEIIINYIYEIFLAFVVFEGSRRT